MNKKELQVEIEQLIQSIRLHYSKINEEVRIPSIELELITAKIRKLHEKSIVYNHMHYLEEQGYFFTAQNPIETLEKTKVVSENTAARDPQTSMSAENKDEKLLVSSSQINAPSTEIIQPSEPVVEKKSLLQDLNSFISLNNKYMFISQLFWGNADEYRSSIQEINQFTSKAEAEDYLKVLAIKFKWPSEGEALESFFNCVRNRFK
jgi:hypothetical protein